MMQLQASRVPQGQAPQSERRAHATKLLEIVAESILRLCGQVGQVYAWMHTVHDAVATAEILATHPLNRHNLMLCVVAARYLFNGLKDGVAVLATLPEPPAIYVNSIATMRAAELEEVRDTSMPDQRKILKVLLKQNIIPNLLVKHCQ